VAIPRLLDMLSIDGAIVTIDAMGCQRGIAQKIIDKKADYGRALKGNQGTLREDVEGPNRQLTASGIRRSAGTRLLMAIASKPAPQP
jgi:predicted transposase YbfD/YdcC